MIRALCLLVLLALSGGAYAQTYTRPTAFAACVARAAQFDAQKAALGQPTGYWCRDYENPAPPNTGTVFLHAPPKNSVGTEMGILYQWTGTCTNGQRWNTQTGLCAPSEAQCKAMPNLAHGVGIGSSGGACSGGCEFKPLVDNGSISFGGKTFTPAAAWAASGGMCGVDTPPPPPVKDQECVPAGANQTFCIKPSGEQCASASTGRQICWKPGETGEKSDNNVMQKRNAGPNALPPSNVNLPSGDTLQQQGTPITSTSTKNGVTTTTTTTNYTTINGTNVGQSDSGESGTGDGSGKPGEGDGEGDGPGTPAEGVTLKRMDGAGGRTLQSVIAAHKARMMASPLISSATGFFTVQASGSCPVWTLPSTDFTPAIVMDFWCVSSLGPVWTMVGVCMLIVFSWVGFRIGVL